MTSPTSSAETWDLVVVGAGPAGATAALAALRQRPDLRVLLLDRAAFPRDKCCGDGIAPHVLDVLRPIGAADVVDGWRPVRDLGLSRGHQQVTGRMVRPVWVVPRAVLDARLVGHAVAAGAELRQHRVREVERRADGVRVDDVLGRVVVAADGAHSVVRRHLTRDRAPRRALAVRGYTPTTPARRARQEIRFGERRQPSYAWSFDRGDGWSNVGYGELVDADDPPTRRLLLEQLELLLPGSVPSGRDWLGHHLPLSGWGWGREQPDGRVLLAGDAAGLVNPMTGEGIYYAVATGALAGRTAADSLSGGLAEGAGARHRAAVRRRFDRHLRHTSAAARLSRHPAIVGAGIVAARRHQRHFDSLVELGLGDGRITPRLAAGLAVGLMSS